MDESTASALAGKRELNEQEIIADTPCLVAVGKEAGRDVPATSALAARFPGALAAFLQGWRTPAC
ncbi:MAG: hypothetical protein Q8Q59_15550 [Luteolibacter sp.]|nr:hypothetical protein [Luteolibacter sp.]